MGYHILCPECGAELASISDAYEMAKNNYYEAILKDKQISKDKIELKPNTLPSTDFILRALGIKKECCVLHILGETSFDLEF
jgi:hypothetical protein